MTAWARLQSFDSSLCTRFQESVSGRGRRLFGLASRVGDGPLWVAAILLSPLYGSWDLAVRLAAVGVVNHLSYRLIKSATARPRPFVVERRIVCAVAPLDQYAFPSGHTMHAVAFTFVLTAQLPWLAILLLPLAAAIALSRVALGLHYPSDVLSGAVLGACVAWLGVSL